MVPQHQINHFPSCPANSGLNYKSKQNGLKDTEWGLRMTRKPLHNSDEKRHVCVEDMKYRDDKDDTSEDASVSAQSFSSFLTLDTVPTLDLETSSLHEGVLRGSHDGSDASIAHPIVTDEDAILYSIVVDEDDEATWELVADTISLQVKPPPQHGAFQERTAYELHHDAVPSVIAFTPHQESRTLHGFVESLFSDRNRAHMFLSMELPSWNFSRGTQ